MFNGMSLKQKILAGGLFPLLLVGIVSLIGVKNFNEVIDGHEWIEQTHEVIVLGDAFEKSALDMETSERGYLITGDEAFLEPHREGEKEYKRIFNELKTRVSDEKALEAIMNANKLISIWEEEVADKYIQIRKELGDAPDAAKIMGEMVAQQIGKNYFDQFRAEMKKFDASVKLLLEKQHDESLLFTEKTNNIVIVGTIVAFLLALLISILMIKMILKPISLIKGTAMQISQGETEISIDTESRDEFSEMIEAFKIMIKSLNGISNIARQIGQGNLNVTIEQRSEKDELSKALKNMVANLNMIMSEIKGNALSLNSLATEIFATTAQVSASANETSASVTQTSASIEEIKQTAKKSSAKAIQSAESAKQTMLIAKTGTEALLKNMNGLNQIKEKMELIASNIIQLSEQSQLISEIITTVEDIANQSNLLAVNASIEAVKAGEHGKGFSVVSQELKNLSERSKQGTKQVQKIIFDIQKVTGTLVMAAEQGGKAVDNGVKEAEEAKLSMDELNNVIVNMANTGRQIAASYEQELSGMNQITDAMNNVKESTIQNVSSIKSLEDSAQDLSKMSQKLKDVLGRYTISNDS